MNDRAPRPAVTRAASLRARGVSSRERREPRPGRTAALRPVSGPIPWAGLEARPRLGFARLRADEISGPGAAPG